MPKWNRWPIKPGQIQQIKMLSKEIGQSDDAYRQMLYDNFDVDSCKKLSYDQAARCIYFLKEAAGKPVKSTSNRFGHLEGRPSYFASPAQLRMVEAMWNDVSNKNTVAEKKDALTQFLRRRFDIMSIERMEKKHVQKVVAALCAMKTELNQPRNFQT